MSLYNQYLSVVNNIKELTALKNELKKKLILDLKEKGVMSSEEDGVKATLSIRQTVKYDSDAIDSLLSKSFTSEEIHKKELDMSKVETLISDGRLNPEEIMQFSEVKTVEALLVKEAK